jgi:DnaJ-class molecular chaperone
MYEKACEGCGAVVNCSKSHGNGTSDKARREIILIIRHGQRIQISLG